MRLRGAISALLLLLTLRLSAQTPDTVTIYGQVVDQSQAAVSDVQITVSSTRTGLQRKAATDQSGHFWFSGLPAAESYDLNANKQGFVGAKSKDLTVAGGTTATIRLQLNAAGGQPR